MALSSEEILQGWAGFATWLLRQDIVWGLTPVSYQQFLLRPYLHRVRPNSSSGWSSDSEDRRALALDDILPEDPDSEREDTPPEESS